MQTNLKKTFAFLLAGTLVLVLTMGCDLLTTPKPNGETTHIVPRALPADFSTLKAISYSGYRSAGNNGNPGTAPTQAQMLEDLQLLQQAGYGLIRLFSSSDEISAVVLGLIADSSNSLSIKVQLGVWINSADEAGNQAEIARGIALANTYNTIVETVSVGNEKMVAWTGAPSVPILDMKRYILQVRGAIPQPVTSDDNWAFYANDGGGNSTDAILASIDYISIHTYPLLDSLYTSGSDSASWDWRQKNVTATGRATAMMNAAIAKAKKDYKAVKDYETSKGYSLPIAVGETGWKAAATNGEFYRAHPVNQLMYLEGLNAWTEPAAIFWFSGFDEPWKSADDGWGIFNAAREARFVLTGASGYAGSFNAEAPPFGITYTRAAGTSGSATHYVPVVSNATTTKNTFLAYADSLSASGTVAIPSGPNATPLTSWIGWDIPWTATGAEITGSGSGLEGTKNWEITPDSTLGGKRTGNANWGWGHFLNLNNAEDLTNFASGHLHFSIKTNYPNSGKLEVGFFTGSSVDGNGCDVYVKITSGSGYGYVADGSWHDVSIPIADIAAHAAPAYGQASSVTMDLSKVTAAFVIADRFANTGNTQKATALVNVDNIYWTQN